MPPHPPIVDKILAVRSPNLHIPSLRKRHSWPSSAKSHANVLDEAVDDNPFSYFVSEPPKNSEACLGGTTAGIDNIPRSRSYSPRYRVALVSSFVTSSPTNRLKRWIAKMEFRYFRGSPSGNSSTSQSPMPSSESFQLSRSSVTPSPQMRGRQDARVGSMRPIKTTGRSRPRRPKAWRAPSADLWPVVEDNEEERVGLGILGA